MCCTTSINAGSWSARNTAPPWKSNFLIPEVPSNLFAHPPDVPSFGRNQMSKPQPRFAAPAGQYNNMVSAGNLTHNASPATSRTKQQTLWVSGVVSTSPWAESDAASRDSDRVRQRTPRTHLYMASKPPDARK